MPFRDRGAWYGNDRTPSGIAFEIGSTVDGLAVWRLKVDGEHVPGRFTIEEGQFVPVEPAHGEDDENGVCRMDIPQPVATVV